MKREDLDHLTSPAGKKVPGVSGATGASVFYGLCIALIIGQLLLHWETLLSMVSIWNRSQTYTHGWIIAPISVYLIWLKRDEISTVSLRPSLVGLGLWTVLNGVWLLGHLAGALVVKQYALVAMIPAIAWAVLGTATAWAIAFPLLFLLLAVPSGEAMVPAMIDFTADFTVKALQMTGIPVYREGTYFSVPSGDWSVVEACSGIRYLIASFTGGCLFAYLYYKGPWKRAAVILASLLIPIIANGIRAYMIVMIGHLSDMRLAVGVDHFIYGWVFFGVVMFALFWVASLWRDDDDSVPSQADGARAVRAQPSVLGAFVVAAVLVVMAGGWWTYARALDTKAAEAGVISLPAFVPANGWTETSNQITDWEPMFRSPDRTLKQTFTAQGRNVQVYVAYYRGQMEGRELISSTNLVVHPEDHRIRVVGQAKMTVQALGFQLQETQTRSDSQRLLIWHWYAVDDSWFINPFRGKWLLAMDRALGRTGEGAAVFIATPYDTIPEPARETLSQFVTQMRGSLNDALEQARKR